MRAAAFESICVCDRRQGGAGGSLAQLNEVIDYYESLIENVDVMSCGRFATETLFCLCQCIVPQLGKICVRSCRIWDITSHSKSEPRTPLCTQIHHQAELEQVKAFKFTFWSIINSLIDPLIKIRVLLWTFACCSCCFEIKSSWGGLIHIFLTQISHTKFQCQALTTPSGFDVTSLTLLNVMGTYLCGHNGVHCKFRTDNYCTILGQDYLCVIASSHHVRVRVWEQKPSEPGRRLWPLCACVFSHISEILLVCSTVALLAVTVVLGRKLWRLQCKATTLNTED